MDVTTATKTIHYEATVNENQFPGEEIPSVATIARLLAGVGHVDRNPRKWPKSSYVPFARSTAMALWQLDAFEYRTAKNQLITVYQLIDDASRFDVGSRAFQRHENSQDAKEVLMQAITEYGAPQEVHSDNSKAFNQLRSGTIGSVELISCLQRKHAHHRASRTTHHPEKERTFTPDLATFLEGQQTARRGRSAEAAQTV